LIDTPQIFSRLFYHLQRKEAETNKEWEDMWNVFIVEDDPKIAELLSDYLLQVNFSVSLFTNGDTVVAEIQKKNPDIVLLDIMLPGKDGLTICREIRSFSNVSIIIITAKVDEIDRVLGLEMGADDYICKPFSPREVIGRIRAILRRRNFEPEEEQLVAGPIKINSSRHRVTIGQEELMVTPNEFELLKILISRPDSVFTRNDLRSKIQGYNFDGDERTIDSHIKNLRKKINKLLPDKSVIQTVYGIGYSFNLSQIMEMDNGGIDEGLSS
jgi:two-component system, OmpR family, response regulator BaeR